MKQSYLKFILLSNLFYLVPLCMSYQTFDSEGRNWFGHGCPPHATGVFPYVGDCKKFYNCYKGRGQLSICGPGTLFNPTTLECDFPSKVTCIAKDAEKPYSRIIDDQNYDHTHHHHHNHQHHSHKFHHTAEYHSQAHKHRHHPNWQETHQQPYSPVTHQRGHYIYSTRTNENGNPYHSSIQPPPPPVKVTPFQPQHSAPPPILILPSQTYHSGVQPPGMLPHSQVNVTPKQPQQSAPSAVILSSHYSPDQSSQNPYLPPPYSPEQSSYNPNPSVPQVFYSKTQPVSPPNYSKKNFKTLNPEFPSSVYVPSYSRKHEVSGIRFPGISVNPVYATPNTPHQSPSPPYRGLNPPYQTPSSTNQEPSNLYQPPNFTHQAPSPSYNTNQAPSPPYQAPSPAYQAPNPTYQASNPIYQAPSPPYQAPSPSYQIPSPNYSPGVNIEHDSSFGQRTVPIDTPVDNSQNPYFPGSIPSVNRVDDSVISKSYGHITTNFNTQKDKCPEDFSGLMAHSDCTKFLSCAHGRTFVMDCGPGTRFHPKLLVCDYPQNVDCNIESTNNDEFTFRIHQDKQNSNNKPAADYDLVTEIETQITQQTTEALGQAELIEEFEERQYETLVKPIISVNEREEVLKNDTDTEPIHVFKPANSTTLKPRFLSKRNSTHERQILRLRGSPHQFEGFVEMQVSPGSWGVMCDKHNKWTSEEAHIVCNTLGFPRGAELTWQGIPEKLSNLTSRLIKSDEIVCSGSEESILECNITMGSGCNPIDDGIWVRCYSHGQSRCDPGEMSLGDKCYFLVVPTEEVSTDHLVGFTQGEALAHCQKKGGHLLDVLSQLENDFVSEWLIRQNVDGNIMTSGVGMSLMGGTIWIWEGSENTFTYHNWWPGWSGSKSIPPLIKSRAQCIVLRRHFPCQEPGEGEEQLCDAQYYFWDIEDCDGMSTSLPYVCERAANNIGCVSGTGASYKGGANVTKTGETCLSWDSKDAIVELMYKVSESERKMSLSGHNYCRTIAGTDPHPWCYVMRGDTIEKEECDIPICSNAIEKSARFIECPPNHFSCGMNGECIPSDKVCDGQYDCSNAIDEKSCTKQPEQAAIDELAVLTEFVTYENSKLIFMEIEIIIDIPLLQCAQKCIERVNCRSFSYQILQDECLLSESNIGLSGSLISASDWNYYELKSKSLNCNNTFICDNGKCIANETVCNGKNDCGDNSDEVNCSWLKQNIQIRLFGGSTKHEGVIEVKAYDDWGLICDDEFDLKDGDVVCRHLGFPLGAQEIKKHSYFKPNHTSKFIIDNLNCTGHESSLADCHHNGWGIHDCHDEEFNSIDYIKCSQKAAGVICKVAQNECNFNYWQCETSAECIPLGFLCDNVKDCADNSDEDPIKCNEPVEIRLVGLGGESRSNKASEGRVEIKRFGVWGTVCDDDFGPNEAEVVCSLLGFSGPAKAYKEGVFGAGKGVIWLDQVHCLGNETSIADCLSEPWGQTNCRHNEDVAVSCTPRNLNVTPKEVSIEEHKVVSENEDTDIDNIFIENCGTVADNLDIISSDFAPRIVSGFETVKGTYPWQASIRLKTISGPSTHWCGAVIVSRLHVLTAGHCLRDYIKSAYSVRAGDYDKEVDEGTEQDLEIDEMWIHTDIDKEVRLNNDVAVVKVKHPGFKFNTWVLPACLPKEEDNYIPHNCTISGWGTSVNPGTGFARTLHATWLSPLPRKVCTSPNVYGNSLTEGMFCAGSLKGGPDSCQGDSGGPFLCPLEGQLTVFGITSWGHGCGRSNSPGVYTNVLYYLDWINEKIKFSMINQEMKISE